MKTCTRCNKDKSLSDYGLDKRNPNNIHLLPACIECRRDRNRDHYRRNRLGVIARTTKYIKENPHIAAKSKSNYRLTDKYLALKKLAPEKMRAYRLKNPELFKKYENKRKGTEGRKQSYRNKSYKRRLAIGTFTSEDFLLKLQMSGYKCVYCSKNLSVKTATRDHKIPISRGGMNIIANISPACSWCNTSKGNKTPKEYLLIKKQ